MNKVTKNQEKRTFDYTTHHKMPKVRFRKRKQAYKGIVNQEPKKIDPDPELFQH